MTAMPGKWMRRNYWSHLPVRTAGRNSAGVRRDATRSTAIFAGRKQSNPAEEGRTVMRKTETKKAYFYLIKDLDGSPLDLMNVLTYATRLNPLISR
jgi:hypothetical protein